MSKEFSIDNEEVSFILWTIRIISPILVCVGTIGNILIVTIYSRVEMRKTTSAVYLGCLAIADTMCLYTGLMRGAFFAYLGQDIVNKNTYLCKTVPFFQFSFQYLSAWILVAFTLERCLVMWQPLLFRPSRSRAAVLVGVLFNMALITNIFYLAQFDVVSVKTRGPDGKEEERRACAPDSEDKYNRFRSFWPIWNILAECVLPTLILMVCNFFIILGVERHKTATKEYEYSSDSTSRTTMDATHRLHPRHVSQPHVHNGLRRAPLFLLIVVNVSHIILTAPRDIFYILYYTYPNYLSGLSSTKAFAIRHFLTVMGYTNNALNFPLYCVTRRDFRHAAHVVLHNLSACCRSDPPPNPFKPRRRNKIDKLPERQISFVDSFPSKDDGLSVSEEDDVFILGPNKLVDLAKKPYVRKPSGQLEMLLWKESVYNLKTMGSSVTLDSAMKRWDSVPNLSPRSSMSAVPARRSVSQGSLSLHAEDKTGHTRRSLSHQRRASARGPKDIGEGAVTDRKWKPSTGPRTMEGEDSNRKWTSMTRKRPSRDHPAPTGDVVSHLSLVDLLEDPVNSASVDVRPENADKAEVRRNVNTHWRL